jgi:hypothetical protein
MNFIETKIYQLQGKVNKLESVAKVKQLLTLWGINYLILISISKMKMFKAKKMSNILKKGRLIVIIQKSRWVLISHKAVLTVKIKED